MASSPRSSPPPTSSLDLRRLGYFVAVAQDRNFTRAAARLHVAQPALSRQIRLLENELGTPLLRRTTHDVELTEAGALLLERATALLASADELWRDLRRLADGETGTVTLGYGSSAAYETAPRLLAELARRVPDLTVRTQVLPAAETAARVEDGTLDVGIVRCAGAGLVLRREPQGVLLRASHPLAHLETVPLDAIDEPVLVHPREQNPGHYDALLALIETPPRLLERRVAVDLAFTPVAAGEAVAIVGESASAPGLVWRPVGATLDVNLLARPLNRTPATARFLAEAEHIARELGWI
jgi:DNA-binding transcriptional LysR family regulator